MTQRMKYQHLYDNCKAKVEKTLNAMWCGVAHNSSQESYVKQLKERVIKDVFAPEKAMPIVQCVNKYKSVHSVSSTEAQSLIGDLWRKSIAPNDYEPYEHQYQSWKALLSESEKVNINGQDKHKSIVVTTGTGSGKTECFMMPLVKDLLDVYEQNPQNCTQAIFIYPLNALMEDQKARMQKLLTGTNLKFAVYNGDMPEREPDANDYTEEAKRIRKRIELIKGIVLDDKGEPVLDGHGNKQYTYPNVIATRNELRATPAHILLTNPTMLEYIMLRKSDESIINPNNHSLRWISIDETHTYSGAGAAELALLIRRVLLAFDVKAEDVRFATSSATLGNASDSNAEAQLKEFISKITGQIPSQIEVVNGERVIVGLPAVGTFNTQWYQLMNEEYVYLNELFPNPVTISEKLCLLDEMCDALSDETSMRVKVHFFFRVPNNGLFVQLDKLEDGGKSFHIHTELESVQPEEAPLLELVRCKHCGEFLAMAEANAVEGTYQAMALDESDMFDLKETSSKKKNVLVISLSERGGIEGDGNISLKISGNRFENIHPRPTGLRVIANATQCCPHCGVSLTKKKSLSSNEEIEEDGRKLQKFRLSSDFISRITAPEILNETITHPSVNGQLHQGQQYISFVDSRQMAASSSLAQNVEQERLWVYSTIFHELCKRKAEITQTQAEIERLKAHGRTIDPFTPEFASIKMRIQELQGLLKTYMTWSDIYNVLLSTPESDIYAWQFAKRRERSEELDDKGNVTQETKERYIQSIMVEYLSRRPKLAAAPETMGLFTTYYEKLQNVKVSEAIQPFNSLLASAQQIGDEDWKNFLQIYIDYSVRSNESMYLHQTNSIVDIFDCKRFATQKPKRRFMRKPIVKDGDQSRMVRYLAQLLVDSTKAADLNDAIRCYREELQMVMDAMWEELTKQGGLLQHSEHYNDTDKNPANHFWDLDKVSKDEITDEDADDIRPYRLNVADISFKLYENVKLCDVNTTIDNNHVANWRPVEVTFKNYSPYLRAYKPEKINEEMIEQWAAYPFYKGSDNCPCDMQNLQEWARNNRRLLWDNGLWDETGIYTDRLNEIYHYPNLFVEAEHTAQVDKIIARRVQKDFKEHKINILACSTTMEMGVDLGSLEIVMMQSVPPRPSNYKQRAGRAGRNDMVRSACITLCPSNAVGFRTLLDPMKYLIMRPVPVPTVDLESRQVFQRHVNAFLVNAFNVFTSGDGSMRQKVLDYYTNFQNDQTTKRIEKKSDNSTVSPNDGLGSSVDTNYEKFNRECDRLLLDPDALLILEPLLSDTIYSTMAYDMVQQAKADNMRCYDELRSALNDLKTPFSSAKSQKQVHFFELKYQERLLEQLLGFWATNRFTPNANMPVNVVAFEVNMSSVQSYGSATISNPSYDLRSALSQYVPGNKVVVDGSVHIVRGVRYTNFYTRQATYKQLYWNPDKVAIDDRALPNKLKWPVNKNESLILIQPKEYIPDRNETATRIQDYNVYTQVDAQLIGTSDWVVPDNDGILYAVRNNREIGDAKILYYNAGVGYGYCHCIYCGRTVLENAPAQDENDMLDDINPITPKDLGDSYHYDLSAYKKGSAPVKCLGCTKSPKDYLKRNVILGDLIQTDFTEIKVRKSYNSNWISSKKADKNFLITLGLVVSQAFANIINKERGDIDFTITPNGHICIFDTNPGGSGYSNRLANSAIFSDTIREAVDIVDAAHSKDFILDRFSLHYAENIDIEAVKDWLKEAKSSYIPESITTVFPTATRSSLTEITNAFANSNTNDILFTYNDFPQWNYGDSTSGWRGAYLNSFVGRQNQTVLCILGDEVKIMEQPIRIIGRELLAWTNGLKAMLNPFSINKIYPLAYIGGILYFTTKIHNAILDENWGRESEYLYAVQTDFDLTGAVDQSCDLLPEEINLFIAPPKQIKSSELGDSIYNFDENAKAIMDAFFTHCSNSAEDLKIVYQDEHLKSVMSMILALQTIEFFVKRIQKKFNLEFKIEQYTDSGDIRATIGANIANNMARDNKLDSLTKNWLLDIEEAYEISGSLTPIISLPKRAMVHWRELSIQCGNKKLVLYPDGGLFNGWNIDTHTATRRYDQEDTSTIDEIPMYLRETIRIGVSSKTINEM